MTADLFDRIDAEHSGMHSLWFNPIGQGKYEDTK